MYELSIVVPIYNVEKYLDNCIKSILSQSFSNFELILVDDGSPDNCGEICEKYKQIDERVKVIHKKNGGLSSARNAGIDIAKGKYIGFVDSDDWINKFMYEKLLKLARENDADMAECRFKEAYGEDEVNKDEDLTDGTFKIVDRYEALQRLIEIGTEHVHAVVSWDKIYKRELFENIRFPEGKIHEDEFTTYKLLYKSSRILRLDEELYYYRKTPDSIMNKKFNVNRLHLLEATHEIVKFLKEHQCHRLYELAVIRYTICLQQYYYKCEDLLDENKLILQDIKANYRKFIKDLAKNKDVSVKQKILAFLFGISPDLYRKIQLKRGKVLY